jgi:hypothetical protein
VAPPSPSAAGAAAAAAAQAAQAALDDRRAAARRFDANVGRWREAVARLRALAKTPLATLPSEAAVKGALVLDLVDASGAPLRLLARTGPGGAAVRGAEVLTPGAAYSLAVVDSATATVTPLSWAHPRPSDPDPTAAPVEADGAASTTPRKKGADKGKDAKAPATGAPAAKKK